MRDSLILTSVMVVCSLPLYLNAQERTLIPSEKIVKKYLVSRLASESRGGLLLTGFRRTNGFAGVMSYYVIEWQGDVTFQRTGYKEEKVWYWYDFEIDRDSILVPYVEYKKGTTIRFTGRATLLRTERGFRVEDLVVMTQQVLTLTPAQEPIPGNNEYSSPSIAHRKAVLISENANLRKTPDLNGQVINTIPKETTLIILKQNGAWFLVRYKHAMGWLHGNTIRVTEP